MSETTDAGLRLNFNVPVRKHVSEAGRREIDLSQLTDDDLFVGDANTLPSETVEAQAGTQQIGYFVGQVYLGHPARPLSYLGLNDDDREGLDNNQVGDLVKAYSDTDDWFYWSAAEHLDEEIYIHGPPGDFLQCAENRIEQDDEYDDIEECLLDWRDHPNIDSQKVTRALVEYDESYRDEYDEYAGNLPFSDGLTRY